MSVLVEQPPVGFDPARDRTAVVDEVAATLADLTTLRTAPGWGWVEIRRPAPTAAFSRRDTLAPGYPEAVAAARRHGFAPIVRPVGGRLAAYHHGALVVDVLARHPSPASATDTRFRAFGQAIAAALRTLGVPAQVGAVPDEYCPGRFSVNAAGRTKLAGSAQRLTRGSFLLSTVLLVSDPEPVRAVIAEAYPQLGLVVDPATVGCVADHVGGVGVGEVRSVVLAALADLLPVGPVPAGGHDEGPLRVPLTGCWEPAR